MKKVKWLWLVPTAMALVAAFFLPRLLLHFEKKEAEEKVETYRDTNSALSDDALNIAQKLSLFADGNYSTLAVEKSERLLTEQEVSEGILGELDKLCLCGAINDAFYKEMLVCFSDGMAITPLLVVDRVGNIAFQYYEIYSYDGLVYARYDPAEGKILCFADQGQAEPLAETFLEPEEENITVNSDLAAIMRAWADYFGLTADQITVYDNAQGMDRGETLNIYLSWCYLYDESGNRFAFALCYQTDLSVLQFSGISALEAEQLAAGAEFDAETPMPDNYLE